MRSSLWWSMLSTAATHTERVQTPSELEHTLADSGGADAPATSVRGCAELLAAELERGASELGESRTGRERPIAVGIAPGDGVVLAALPLDPRLRADPQAVPDAIELAAAAVAALVEAPIPDRRRGGRPSAAARRARRAAPALLPGGRPALGGRVRARRSTTPAQASTACGARPAAARARARAAGPAPAHRGHPPAARDRGDRAPRRLAARRRLARGPRGPGAALARAARAPCPAPTTTPTRTGA